MNKDLNFSISTLAPHNRPEIGSHCVIAASSMSLSPAVDRVSGADASFGSHEAINIPQKRDSSQRALEAGDPFR
jgi:hypothetical protein